VVTIFTVCTLQIIKKCCSSMAKIQNARVSDVARVSGFPHIF